MCKIFSILCNIVLYFVMMYCIVMYFLSTFSISHVSWFFRVFFMNGQFSGPTYHGPRSWHRPLSRPHRGSVPTEGRSSRRVVLQSLNRTDHTNCSTSWLCLECRSKTSHTVSLSRARRRSQERSTRRIYWSTCSRVRSSRSASSRSQRVWGRPCTSHTSSGLFGCRRCPCRSTVIQNKR